MWTQLIQSGRSMSTPTSRRPTKVKTLLALQRCECSLWDNLQNNSMWLDLNSELKDLTYPSLGTQVHVRRFMEPTIDKLTPSLATTKGGAQSKPRPQRSSMRQTAPPALVDFVDLGDDNNDEAEPRPA